MDVELYSRILWRFRLLVAIGVALAIVLSVLAFAKVSFAGGSPTLKYRQAQTWQSEAVLFVTQRGFPWGSTTPQYQPANATQGLPAVPTADANRLSGQAVLYSQLATTHQVQRLMRHPPVKPTDDGGQHDVRRPPIVQRRHRPVAAPFASSPGWTRTNNPPVNSRMLCQLSYRGSAAAIVARLSISSRSSATRCASDCRRSAGAV